MSEFIDKSDLVDLESFEVCHLTRTVCEDRGTQVANCVVHELVVMKQSDGSRLVDFIEARTMLADPQTKSTATMSIGSKNILSGRRSQHATPEHTAAPAQMRLDSCVQFGNEFFDLLGKNRHGATPIRLV